MNPRPSDYKTDALAAELLGQTVGFFGGGVPIVEKEEHGAGDGIRTHGLRQEADALPLSYTRMDACWCAKPWTHEAPVFLPIVSEG